MRWWTKTMLWAGILLACAAVGAFIASRSNPFPPGVAGGGTTSRPSSSPTQGPDTRRWTLVLRSQTSHTYRVGGACISHWRLRAPIRVLSSGRVIGRRVGSELRLRFDDQGTRPVGSQDLGAFVEFLPRLRVAIPEQASAQVARRKEFTDANGDVFVMSSDLRLTR